MRIQLSFGKFDKYKQLLNRSNYIKLPALLRMPLLKINHSLNGLLAGRKISSPVKLNENKNNNHNLIPTPRHNLPLFLLPFARKDIHTVVRQTKARKLSTLSGSQDKQNAEQPLVMRKVFWDNPYQHLLFPKVTWVNGQKVLFDETIVYSFSGGQESDKATINEMPIIDSKMEGHLIYYTLPENHGLKIGDTVKMAIDWPRRYRLMRLHFAAELVLEIVTQKYHLEKVGARICEEKSRVDFLFNKHISCLFDEILNEYNKIIKEDKLIKVGYSNIKTQRRFWKIDNFAEVPCGGTHVRSTGEVGYVSLKRSRGGKSVERIEIIPINNDVPKSTHFVYQNYKPNI